MFNDNNGADRRRILITGPSLRDPGGVSSYYNAVLPHLRQSCEFDIHYLEIGSTQGRDGFMHPIADQFRFRRALKQLKPALVHCNPSLVIKSYLRDGVFIHQAKRLGYPVMVLFHGWDKGFESRVDQSLRWFFKATYRKADAYMVLATAFRKKLESWGVSAPVGVGTTTVPIELLQDFSLTEKWRETARDASIRILFLARLEREKGILETLGALSLLRGKGLPATLTVAGDGVAMAEVRSYANAHPELDGALTIAGDVRGERKKALFAAHDIYCFPSYGEGMPTSVLEAMAFGLPVVTTAVGGLADFFEDEKMGCLLHRTTAQDVADAIEKLACNPPLLRTIAHYNQCYALDHFLAPVTAERLLAIYRDTAGRGTPRGR